MFNWDLGVSASLGFSHSPPLIMCHSKVKFELSVSSFHKLASFLFNSENLAKTCYHDEPKLCTVRELGSHRFSEPWEDSDMILVVEDEKFHVHRVILIVNSPVFMAMFKSEFKEARANKVPLPEKKANEVLDFLKQLYVQEREEITSKHFYATRIINER